MVRAIGTALGPGHRGGRSCREARNGGGIPCHGGRRGRAGGRGVQKEEVEVGLAGRVNSRQIK